MSNSNYTISLQRLKPSDTVYFGMHNLAENWSWARDVNGRDRDEAETLTIFLEKRPRRDVGASDRSRIRYLDKKNSRILTNFPKLKKIRKNSYKNSLNARVGVAFQQQLKNLMRFTVSY